MHSRSSICAHKQGLSCTQIGYAVLKRTTLRVVANWALTELSWRDPSINTCITVAILAQGTFCLTDSQLSWCLCWHVHFTTIDVFAHRGNLVLLANACVRRSPALSYSWMTGCHINDHYVHIWGEVRGATDMAWQFNIVKLEPWARTPQEHLQRSSRCLRSCDSFKVKCLVR